MTTSSADARENEDTGTGTGTGTGSSGSVRGRSRRASHPGGGADRDVGAPGRDLGRGPARDDRLRTVKYLMLFRVGLATLLLGLNVLAALSSSGGGDGLTAPFAGFVFGLITATYAASLAYALLYTRVEDPVSFAYWQIGIDLLLATALVHATGGAQSGFFFLYLVDVVAVTLLARRRGAALVAMSGIALMCGVSILGYLRVLPLVPGQLVLPWDVPRGVLLTKLTLNSAALIAVGVLSSRLAALNRHADEQVSRHVAMAGDLARLHENTIRSLTSGLVTLDLGGAVTSANGFACEILGRAVGVLLGVPLAEVLPELSRILAEAGPGGTVRRCEVVARRPDGGARHLGISAAPLSDRTGKHIGRVIHFQDLTELKRMELAVARAERLATIGRLSAAIAHEIRNPLASISGSIELLRAAPPGTEPESRQLMDIAIREVERLNALITSLLDYARPSSEERRALDLAEEVREIVQAFEREKRAAHQAIAVETTAFEPGVRVQAAPGQIRQIVWNLLHNAAEAMPDGGKIVLSVKRSLAGAGAAAVREVSARDPVAASAVLVVADTGSGIPRADLDHIFEPFFSTKRTGTGLGLATVARIVDDHQGTIEIASEVGKGTSVTLRLPLDAASELARAQSRAA
jgi:two-component system sensor histidine kinase PilS (NtrC family)